MSNELIGILSVATVAIDGSAGAVVKVETRFELPNKGKSNSVYLVANENAVYRWDEDNLKYFCVGRDYQEIECICGGDANGSKGT